ncbi:PAS domain-containing protein [Pseudanabaena mucicola]|uniref:histidine kinase n=1 Tax=Pseudanabaena mucicola FACHB-723 TaxID=2692860 RepID=A0ABR7ZXG2_9CYAN|nr:PAS domain-containing protein [Pseudanabaena mucicola]MBD2188160.1 PAS domain-containing protein [Pseudanabaena mucicola FACHB-723]
MVSSDSTEICLEGILDRLTEISVQIHNSTNLVDLLNVTVQQTRLLLQCDRVLIYQFLPENDGAVTAESVSGDCKSILGEPISDPCFAKNGANIYQTGKCSVISDTRTSSLESCYANFLAQIQVRANLIIPILIGSQPSAHLFGLIIAHQCDRPRNWQAYEIGILQNIATQIGIALRTESQYTQNLQTNSDITTETISPKLAQSDMFWKESLLPIMSDGSPLGFLVVDNRTDEIIYCNHRFCEIWGLEHLEAQIYNGELKNNDIIPDCIPLIADLPTFVESCKPLQSEANRTVVEDEIAFNDNRVIRRFSSQIRDGHDCYLGRMYIFEDITNRKQIEQQIKVNEERQQFAIEGSGDGIWDWNVQTNEVFFSPQWKSMLGFADDEIINNVSEWDQRIHPNDREQVYAEVHKHLRGEIPRYLSEHRLKCKDGNYKWILDRGQVVSWTSDDEPLRFIGTHVDISDRKNMESALQASEARQSAIIEALPDLLLCVRRDGLCLSIINTSSIEGNKFAKINQHLSEVLPPELLQKQLQAIEKAITTKELQVYKHQLMKSGRVAHEEVRIAAINDQEALVIVRDITSQIEADQRLEQISLNVPGFIYQYRLRPDGSPHFSYASHGIYDVYGFLPEEVYEDANPVLDRLHPDDLDRVIQSIHESAENLHIWLCEYRVKFADGRTIWVAGHATPQREPDGSVLWHGYIQEITQRKQAELDLIESESKLREAYLEQNALFAAMSDMVLVRDHEGKCLKIVPTAFDYLIGKPEHILSQPIDQELPQPAAGIIASTIQTALADYKIVSCDYCLEIDGEDIWFAATISPIAKDRVIQIARNITERKQAEIALEKAKEDAEAATRAKSEFLANMSHEIRTPMNGVLGMAELLSLTPLTEEQQDYVQTIRDSGDILLSVINDILDFSKIEAGKLELESRPFVLVEATRSVYQMLSPQAASQQNTLNFAIANDVPKIIVGDIARINQILINLISNAIKFTKQGAVQLEVNRRQSAQGDMQLIFKVKDTGIGIDCDRIQMLFTPFAQADASISRKYGGTGLGLAICKCLVQLMGGKLWVESKGHIGGEAPLDWNITTDSQSQGASFYFTISLPNQSATKVPSSDVDGAAPLEPQILLADQFPLKILIVEDNEVNQRIASLYLKKLGYLADIAANGLEALRKLSNQNYDLLLMDLQMPEMDGITAARLIRQDHKINPQPQIVAMTANVMPEDIKKCHEAGMNDHIGKPIRSEDLVRVLTHART